MNYRALMRRKLFEEMYDRLSEDDKRLYIQMTMQDKDHKEIMQALRELESKADMNRHSFASDLLANISGNAIFDGLVWVGSKLLKKLPTFAVLVRVAYAALFYFINRCSVCKSINNVKTDKKYSK